VTDEDKIMPKMKTKKCLVKRFKVTGTGKLMRRTAGKSHRMVSFTGKRVRQLRRSKRVTGRIARKILRGLQAG
jgi:large subunit ribosomal protein L35